MTVMTATRKQRIADYAATLSDEQALQLVADGSGIEREAAFHALRTRPSLASAYQADSAARYSPKSREELAADRASRQTTECDKLLLADGWKLECVSESGSLYYVRGENRLRVANHEVPLTDEREHNSSLGLWNWSKCGRQIILPVDDVAVAVAALNDE